MSILLVDNNQDNTIEIHFCIKNKLEFRIYFTYSKKYE